MDLLQKLKDKKPQHFTRAVSGSLRRLASHHPGASSDPAPSARGHVGFNIPFGPNKTLGYLAWGFALHATRTLL